MTTDSRSLISQVLPEKLAVEGMQDVTNICFKRSGVPLSGAYAVTDYYCQGASFKNDCWFLHLTPPAQHFSRASVLVALTRFASWSKVKSIAPVYDPRIKGSKDKVIRRFLSAAAMDPMLSSELARLRELTRKTEAKYSVFVQRELAV